MKTVKKKEIERAIRKICITKTQAETTDTKMDKQTLSDALAAYDNSKNLKSIIFKPNIRRTIMKTKLRRLTAAAIAFACLVTLCYGVGKLVTTFFVVDEVVVTYPDEKNGGESAYGWRAAVMTNESLNDEEIAKKVKEYDYDPNDPNNVRRKEEMKQIFKELHELRQAGKFERTFVKEDEQDGIKIRFYKDHFTLSNGKTITMNIQESWKDGKLIGAGGGWGGGAAENWDGKETRTEKK